MNFQKLTYAVLLSVFTISFCAIAAPKAPARKPAPPSFGRKSTMGSPMMSNEMRIKCSGNGVRLKGSLYYFPEEETFSFAFLDVQTKKEFFRTVGFDGTYSDDAFNLTGEWGDNKFNTQINLSGKSSLKVNSDEIALNCVNRDS